MKVCLFLCCICCLGCSIAINVMKADEPKQTDGEYIPDNSTESNWEEGEGEGEGEGEAEPPLDDTVTLTFIYNDIARLNSVYKKIRVKKGSTYKFSFWDVPVALPFTIIGWSEQRFLGGDYWLPKRNQDWIDIKNKVDPFVQTGVMKPYKRLYVVGLDSYVADKDTVFYATWGRWLPPVPIG